MPPRDRPRVGALVLAAGGSVRLGRPKQLITADGRTLVRNAVLAAVQGGCRPVLVVIGAHAARVRREIEDLATSIVEHPGWEEGLGSSIARGMGALREHPEEPDALMLLLCDQPRLTPNVVRALSRAWRRAFLDRGATMAACAYAGTLGTPAVFSRAEYSRLSELGGDRGAQRLLLESPDRVTRLAWPAGALDVDRADDCDSPTREL